VSPYPGCCSPYVTSCVSTSNDTTRCTPYDYGSLTCGNRVNLVDLVTPCRPVNASACQQPVYCTGARSTCAVSAEVQSVVSASAGAGLTLVGAPGVLPSGAMWFWANASRLALRVVGTFGVPTYCPAVTFAVGSLPAPLDGCANAR
jgi:hypothetical protein